MFQRKVIDYKIIRKDSSEELEEEVLIHLKNGWELYGFPYWSGTYHRQALVMYDDNIHLNNKETKIN